jgi:hypothetical protein
LCAQSRENLFRCPSATIPGSIMGNVANFIEKWNARLLPNYCPECERGPGPFATRRLYEPEVDELFLTHLLVLPSTRIFLSSRFSIRTSSRVKLAGLSLSSLTSSEGASRAVSPASRFLPSRS